MKINANIAQKVEYIQKHWFKLIFLTIILYLFTQKEFSFNIQLNDPKDSQEFQMDQERQSQPSQRKQYYTEKSTSKKGILDHFDFSPFQHSHKNTILKQLANIPEAQKEVYLKRFTKVAIGERHKFGIPSSVILGTALLHSLAGGQGIANTANNHFLIHCSNDWQGPIEKNNGKCYRVYENAWTSFRDNSLYITSGKYAHLKSLGSTDYKTWAYNLEKAGYSELDHFADQLIQVIELYGLDAFDNK